MNAMHRSLHLARPLVASVGKGLLFLSLLLLPACSSVHPVVEESATISDSPLLMPGYLLDVRVMVSGVNEVNEKGLSIQEDGTITLPFLGSINSSAMTQDGFRNLLTEEYNTKYFINPIVSVAISIDDNAGAFPWGYVTVLGQIKEPGRIRISPTRNLTAMQAIQQAGGFIKYAK